jgi:hypothetical protein
MNVRTAEEKEIYQPATGTGSRKGGCSPGSLADVMNNL